LPITLIIHQKVEKVQLYDEKKQVLT
jgi:hypothetical protein